MPTYEYQCLDCEYRFEAYQNISEPPLNLCPRCGKRLKRLIGAGSTIIFKGSGFFVNDYKKKSPPESSRKQTENQGDSQFPQTQESNKQGD